MFSKRAKRKIKQVCVKASSKSVFVMIQSRVFPLKIASWRRSGVERVNITLIMHRCYKRGEGSLETTCIRTEESLKYSIDIGIVLDEMKYGIAWIRSLANPLPLRCKKGMVFKGATRMYQIVQVSNSLWPCPRTLSIVKSKTIWYSPVAPLKTITFS